MKRKKVLLGVSASIAAYKACDIINRLKENKVDVEVCMSRDADQFISELTLRTLSGNRVYSNMFDLKPEWDPLHISLAERADLILIAPASYDIINKIACGISDDLLCCAVASTKRQVIFAPAMNEAMYNNRILQANITKLKSLGYEFVGPIKGKLACGDTGIGHIAEVSDIVTRVKTLLK